ncbi:MAG: tripartite tricarboxylate transporter TctB family protein [Gemmatimonas sp.]
MTESTQRHGGQDGNRDRKQSIATVRSVQDLAAGLFLIAIAAFALWQSRELPTGSLRVLGPGWVPHVLAVLLGACGLILVVSAFRSAGPAVERWAFRGPLFVFGAALVFAATVRPLGLAVAGPLLILVSGAASHETRWIETLIFGILMTAFCLGLFRLLLSLPIPVAPWLIGY